MVDSQNQVSEDSGGSQSTAGNVLITLKSVPQRSYGRDLRLREGDVIVAIDGIPCNVDILEFEDMLLDAQDDETALFVTIGRDQIFFEIFLDGPLGVGFDYTESEHAQAVTEQFAGHEVGPKEHYQTYEALRDVHRHVTVYSTEYSGLAAICPPLWLMQHRAFEPLAAVIGAYAAAAAVHWGLLFVIVVLIGIYFHRIQYRIIRNYNIFTEHFFWVVCAARNMAEAQKICRDIDPKSIFSFSYVGPPEDAELDGKKASRRATRRSEPAM